MANEYFEVRVEGAFDAGHTVGPDGAMVPAHDHRWSVAVRAGSARLDAIAIVVDFRRLRADLDVVLGELNGQMLEELPAFAGQRADAAAVGTWLLGRLRGRAEGAAYRIVAVEVACDDGVRWVIGDAGAAGHAPV